MTNSKAYPYLAIVAICLLVSCVSKRTYTGVYRQLIALKSDSAKVHDALNETRLAESRLQASDLLLRKQLTDNAFHFDTTVNSIIATADKRVAMMNAQYEEKMKNQIKLLSTAVTNNYKTLFKKQIESGLVTVENKETSVVLELDIDKLYDPDSLEFNTEGKTIIAELAAEESVRKYYVSAKNVISYKNTAGKLTEVDINSSVLSDFLSMTEESGIQGDFSEELPDSLNKYVSQHIRLQFFFGFDRLEQPYFNIIAQHGQIIEKYTASSIVLASVGQSNAYRSVSLSFGDNNNDKYVLNPSDFLIGRFDLASEADVVKKLNILIRKQRPTTIRVSGSDKIEGICNNRKAVIVLSPKGKVIKKYPGRYFECENDIINLNQ